MFFRRQTTKHKVKMDSGGGAWSDDWYEDRQHAHKGHARVPHRNEDGTTSVMEVPDDMIDEYRERHNKQINMNRQERGDSASRRRLRNTGRKIKDLAVEAYKHHRQALGLGAIATGSAGLLYAAKHWPKRVKTAKPVRPFNRIP